ncbi:glutamate receptor U1-like [Palaemon carinicauda]|uniref:glutamate receptor U1-like n=1 Tax=Palaemon carinicauda TaxID=392227 RepID=UPI0035B612CF
MVPLYKVKVNHRFQCLTHVLIQWLESSSKDSGSIKSSSNSSRNPVSFNRFLLPAVSKVFTGNNEYQQMYITCVGSDALLNEDEIELEAYPPMMLMRIGRRVLNGKKMIVATIHRPPFAILEMSGDDIVGAKGFCYEMLNSMAQKFNFTYSLLPPYDGNWGGLMPNGSFNGMVGMVQRKVVDLALASITITFIRERVIDFTHPFFEEPTAILIPPPKEQDNFLAFLNPFSWQVWLLILLSAVVAGCAMWLLSISNYLLIPQPHERKNKMPYYYYIWGCTFLLTSQSIRLKLEGPAMILNGFWLFMCVIFIYTYTGNLIAFLTVPQMSNVIKSLEELANQKEILWTYRSNSAHETLFANAPAPGTYYKIGKLLKERPDLFVSSDMGGVEAVLRGQTAFIKEKSWLDFAMESDYLSTKKCRLYQVRDDFFGAGYGCVLQQNAVYLRLFNAEVLRMMQNGLFSIWRRKYWPKPNECSSIKRSTTGPRALHLSNFFGHFSLYIIGLGLSFITYLLERIYHSFSLDK